MIQTLLWPLGNRRPYSRLEQTQRIHLKARLPDNLPFHAVKIQRVVERSSRNVCIEQVRFYRRSDARVSCADSYYGYLS